MLSQVRSLRGTISSKTRDAIFSMFGEDSLPRIHSNASPIDIAEWKQSREVASCYKKLFERVNEDEPLHLSKIIKKVTGKKSPTNVETAYIIAICTTILDPKTSTLMLKESVMKRKVKYYLVGFATL